VPALPVIFAGGEPRKLGNIAPAAALTRAFPLFGTVANAPLIPRSQWDAKLRGVDLAADPYLTPVTDQNGVGQCNANATCSAMESSRAEQGLPYVQLSPADLYARINHGIDEGSTLQDGLDQAMTAGVGTAATSGMLWQRGIPQASAVERARYRVLEAFLCPDFDACFSAVIAGFNLISGVMWFNNYTPGADGWLPPPRGSPAGGHAVYGYVPMKKGSTYGIGHQNSWSVNWGIKGRCVFPEPMYRDPSVGGWWAVRLVVDEGAHVPAPLPELPELPEAAS
jgi:hypothetical protein